MTAQNPQPKILKHSTKGGKTKADEINLLDYIAPPESPGVDPEKEKPRLLPERCYIFLDKKTYSEKEGFRKKLLHSLNVPDFLNNKTCTELNGYFGCRGTYGDRDKLESYSTWFRCLVKMVGEIDVESGAPKNTAPKDPEKTVTKVHKNKKPDKNYEWHEMGFFTCWDKSGGCRVLCVDTPEELQSGLEATVSKSPPNPHDPFAMHVPLIDEIVKLNDKSVWRIRDPIRHIEKNREKGKRDFGEMHEISRHAVHIFEVLSVTIETIERLQQQQKTVYEGLSSLLGKNHREQEQAYMSFQVQMLKSLKLRSESNYERLKSEITLAYNMIAQQDNSVMKSIAVLTMTFLPATFISALFSTTFFSFSDQGWQVSGQIWIYWVVTLPASILVMIIWRLWLRYKARKPFVPSFVKKALEGKEPAGPKKDVP